ncbi:ATP-dependent RNA helicase HrpA [Corynebacterium uropygiale]|uniref:ATP-dependent RNA helicase HrpA n=1 Tax=Corynebacterium uropygiale TaxID=1775911 RepID=A0A9X1QPL0_9CORY|nr:ATP-dependent RNA helicase HrpA [Corynebacterium uropygiale]MCF4006481.1 ATP-dependent RNA helicase HrpA [Corynebacterium uropygiale]
MSSHSPSSSPRPHAPSKAELYRRLDGVSIAEERRFRRRLKKARSPQALSAIEKDLAHAEQRVARRDALIPEIAYPSQLPVSERRDDIAEAIEKNQVVIIAGETGSGKTTQIPKICLDIGRGRRGLIGHTQPRRIAARTVAERIADELGQNIGEAVGYAIRFDDRVSASTSVKLMTDGILLAEMQRDRYFEAYDTIIIDEAHERSLNIDFLLGYLKKLLPRRPDLKVIITSATIDPESFAEHFAAPDGTPAPIIEVSGRTYPVEVRYRPLEVERGEKLVDIDPLDGVLQACEELMAEGPGDILCFFPGERDIRDAAEAIEGRRWKNVEVTPLFGRLSNQEQHRVFSPHSGRRIVLATNIAETSLTVPGIRYVVDTGTARISRYSVRTKVQRLPIEPISQASANQRSGRCGRVAEGIAIRLYSEEDFLSRPEFTDPEILRTNLASVILHMAHLRLGDISQFPFVQPPEHKAIRDGLLLLHELGALSGDEQHNEPVLTPIGSTLAQIPVDPRMGRMLIEADHWGCLRDTIVIVAAMTIQDVRERPLEFQAQADQKHARFKDKKSDFLGTLKLWDYISEQRRELSGNKFRKLMQAEYLHYLRIREWRDLVAQLHDVIRDLGWTLPSERVEERDPDAIHRSLLAGLLSHIGIRESESHEFRGARQTRFRIFPGSALAKKPPQFVMAAELVETSRLWARQVAAIDPQWAESIAPQLLKHHYSEPSWSRKKAAAQVHQRSTLYGVPVVEDRVIPYHTVDARAAREIFIRHALIEGDWSTHHAFFHKNRETLAEATEVEERLRRRGIVADEDVLYQFYDERLPESITTGATFDHWWKKTQRKKPHLLDLDLEALLSDEASAATEVDFPGTWTHSEHEFALSYRFEPGHPEDGVTVHVPLPMLASVDPTPFSWLVPGFRHELITELIRSLPKVWRRGLVPAPDYATKALSQLTPYESSLYEQLADVLRTFGATGVSASDFDLTKLPPYLRMNIAAVDKRQKVVDSDRDIEALRRRRSQQIRSSVSKVSRTMESDVAKEWTEDTLGTIPETVMTTVDGQQVEAYPALVLDERGLRMKVLPTRSAADAAMMTSTLALLMRAVTIAPNPMIKGLPLQQKVAVERYPHGGAKGLVNDARIASLRDLLLEHGGPVRSPAEFRKLKDNVVREAPSLVRRTIVTVAPALVSYDRLRQELDGWTGEAIEDMRQQLDFMFPPNALSVHGLSRLQHVPRYLQAMEIRLEDMDRDPDRDADRQDIVWEAQDSLEDKLKQLPSTRATSTAVRDIQWMIEELRVSLFAQRLGTAQPVSLKRIRKAIDKLR